LVCIIIGSSPIKRDPVIRGAGKNQLIILGKMDQKQMGKRVKEIEESPGILKCI
jgi:hypothetical protein